MVENLSTKLDLVWGAKAIARELGVSTRRAFHLLENGAVPAKKIANRWVADRNSLRSHFLAEVA